MFASLIAVPQKGSKTGKLEPSPPPPRTPQRKTKNFDLRLAVVNRNMVTAADMIKNDADVETLVTPAESPALKSFYDQKKSNHAISTANRINTSHNVNMNAKVMDFCYRPLLMETAGKRDVRIKNIHGPEGYQAPVEEEANTGFVKDDMVADVFKIEGNIIRDVIFSLNERSMKWLKSEFDREMNKSLTGPQFINTISELLNNAKEGTLDEDEDGVEGKGSESDAKKKKIIGFGLGSYKSKTIKEVRGRRRRRARSKKSKGPTVEATVRNMC